MGSMVFIHVEGPGPVFNAVVQVLIVAAFVCILHAWSVGRSHLQKLDLPTWRRKTAVVGLVAVTIQAALLLAILTYGLVQIELSIRLALFAIPCAFTARGPFRWWLFLSSIGLLFVFWFIARAV